MAQTSAHGNISVWLDRLVKTSGGTEWYRLSDVYGPLLSGWIARAGVASSDRDDLVQEVLLVVVRRVGDFEHQRDVSVA